MRRMLRVASMLLATMLFPLSMRGQTSTPRELRIEVRDRSGRPIPDAAINFFLSGDSARTDSSGVATITVLVRNSINISIRKIGFEPRDARFAVGSAPAFSVRVAMGDAGQRLPEVEVRDSYPGQPWRTAYEQRKKRGGGQFRDISYFPGGVPFSMADWFNGLPGVRTGGGSGAEINVSRCRNLGVWIDGQHATSPGSGHRAAMQTLSPQDIAAFELHTSNTPAQYTGQTEDCSLLFWTRLR